MYRKPYTNIAAKGAGMDTVDINLILERIDQINDSLERIATALEKQNDGDLGDVKMKVNVDSKGLYEEIVKHHSTF